MEFAQAVLPSRSLFVTSGLRPLYYEKEIISSAATAKPVHTIANPGTPVKRRATRARHFESPSKEIEFEKVVGALKDQLAIAAALE
jgi:hypothetical protein